MATSVWEDGVGAGADLLSVACAVLPEGAADLCVDGSSLDGVRGRGTLWGGVKICWLCVMLDCAPIGACVGVYAVGPANLLLGWKGGSVC